MINHQVRIPIDGICLDGTLDIPKCPIGIVLFAHGSGSSRFSPRNNYVAARLRECGIGTLLLDLLTAEEDKNYSTRFDIHLLTARLAGALNWICLNDAINTRILGLFGASTGAAAALQLAALYEEYGILPNCVRAIVSRGGRPDLAGEKALKAITTPTLFIVGGEDQAVIRLNEQAYTLMKCQKQLQIISGATHLFEEAGALEQVSEFAIAWFLKYFKSTSSNIK